MQLPLFTLVSQRLSMLLLAAGVMLAANTAVAQCAATIAADTLIADTRGSGVTFCVDVDFDLALRSDRFIDGNLVAEPPRGCNFDSLTFYPYNTFPGGGNTGPYNLVGWQVDGQTFTGTFDNIAQLVALFNQFDPAGDWSQDATTNNLVGSGETSNYGVLEVQLQSSGASRVETPNYQAVARGIAVSVSGGGYHEFVLDDADNGCRDTLVLFLRPTLADVDVQVVTEFVTATEVICASTDGLPGTPTSFTICGAPDDGTIADEGGFCFSYTPDAGTTGSDRFCIEVCDDTPRPEGPICRRTNVEVIVRSQPDLTVDTLRYQIPNSDTIVCIADALDIARPYDSAELCGPQPTGFEVAFLTPRGTACISLQPEAGFSGEGTVCVRYCTNGICEETVLVVTVQSRCAEGIFATDAVEVTDANGPVRYCIPLSQNELSEFDILLNGQPYTGGTTPCDPVTQSSYNYAPIFGRGQVGPFALERWEVDGNDLSGEFDDAQGLERLMRQLDPRGNWRIDAVQFVIEGGVVGGDYGLMRIVELATGSRNDLFANATTTTRGTTVELPGRGVFDLLLNSRDGSGCSDKITITVGEPDTPGGSTSQTINVDLVSGESSDLTCLFANPRSNVTSCGDVTNGVAVIDDNGCVVYTPNTKFVGTDRLCAVSCSVDDPAVCDTTFVVFNVAARQDTFPNIDADVTSTGTGEFLACATDALAIDGPFLTPTFCGVGAELTASPSNVDGCIVIDPTAGATTGGTVCVEFCRQANPRQCQRVTFNVTLQATCTPAVFNVDTVFLDATQGNVLYCLADGADLSAYDIMVNGQAVTPIETNDCGITSGGGGGSGTQDAYFYQTVLLADGAYRLEGWDINGTLVEGIDVASFSALADSMSAYDPTLTWTYDEAEGGIVADGATGNRSQLLLFDPQFGSSLSITLQTIQVGDDGGGDGTFTPGAAINLPAAGIYEIDLFDNVNDCGDRLVIFRRGGRTPTVDTIRVVATSGEASGPFCVSTAELSGPITSIESCGDPLQGSVAFTSLECFTYTSNAGFVGEDEVCIVACSANGLVCDTTIYRIDVRPLDTGGPDCPAIFATAGFVAQVDSCATPEAVCLPRLAGETFDYSFTVDGVARPEAMACGGDSTTTYSYADLPGVGEAGPYRVEDYFVRGVSFTAEVIDVRALVDSLNQWDAAGAWMLNAQNSTVTGGVSGTIYNTLVLRQLATDSLSRLAPITTVRENRVSFEFTPGSYEVVATTIADGCTDTLSVLVTCAADSTCTDLIALDGTALRTEDCDAQAGFTVVNLGKSADDLMLFVDGVRADATLFDSTAVIFLDTGTYTVTVVDMQTNCTSEFAVSVECGCVEALPSLIARSVDCALPNYDVCLPISADELRGYDITVDGGAYTGLITECDQRQLLEYSLLGLPGGGDAGPYAVDNFVINGEAFNADVADVRALVDSLDRWDTSASWRYDENEGVARGGNVNSTYSALTITQIVTGQQVTLVAEQTTASSAASIRIIAGAGTRIITIDDRDGCLQQVTLNLVCVQASTDTDTVNVLETVLFCVNTSELSGPVVSLTNVCDDPTGAASFDFDAPAGCVTATGVTTGSTTACLVACNAAGVCDTTFYTVFVRPEGGAVIAVDDTLRIRVDETGLISVTANDTFGLLTSVRIVTSPTRGAASVNNQGILTYTPIAGACGFIDSLVYEICSGINCVQANVYVRVRCDLVEAYGGFTPNGDGQNEVFVIAGIEDYPDANVQVYNRWGNLVFEADGNYQNDWEGTWDGNQLTEGTYFYLIQIPDEEVLSGYVQIWR